MTLKHALMFVTFLAGCPGPRMVSLETLQLHTPTAWAPHTDSRICVARFVDDRGEEYGRASPTSYMPVVSLVHRGYTLHYPEHTGALRSKEGVVIGGMDNAVSRLLAETLRKTVAPAAWSSAEPSVAPRSDESDYVVSGRLLISQYHEDESQLLAITLGMFGVPFRFGRVELGMEVFLFRAGEPNQPLWHREYRFTDRKAAGLYYNKQMALPLIRRGLEQLLPQIANDLGSIIALADRGAPLG
jgi:hypothetical protein